MLQDTWYMMSRCTWRNWAVCALCALCWSFEVFTRRLFCLVPTTHTFTNTWLHSWSWHQMLPCKDDCVASVTRHAPFSCTSCPALPQTWISYFPFAQLSCERRYQLHKCAIQSNWTRLSFSGTAKRFLLLWGDCIWAGPHLKNWLKTAV